MAKGRWKVCGRTPSYFLRACLEIEQSVNGLVLRGVEPGMQEQWLEETWESRQAKEP